MNTSRRLLAAFLMVAGSVSALMMTPSPAFALNCIPGPPNVATNSFLGMYDNEYSTGPRLEGSSANILTRTNTPCTNIDHSLATWSMIADPYNRVTNHYAQAGYLYSPSGGLRAFTQANDGYTPATSYGPSLANGTVYHFWTQYVPGTGRINMNMGSTILATSAFNPVAAWSNTPWQPQFFSEGQFYEDNMPGSPAHPVVWSDFQYQRYSDDQFIPSGCTLLALNRDEPSYWSVDKLNCYDFHTYTRVQR